MKKTVSITIAGQLFHVEEDAYERLRPYLDSIQRYFAASEDAREIIADIEQRIGELFAGRLAAEGRQAVTLEDVAAVQTTMGTVDDFRAAEAAEAEAEPAYGPYAGAAGGSAYAGAGGQSARFGAGYNPGAGAAGPGAQAEAPRTHRWYRNQRDKLVSGVLSGLGAYIGVDPIWVRVAFVLCAVGFWWLPVMGPGLVVAYIVMAVILPKADLGPATEQPPRRRFLREPDGAVVGGVAGGLASYLSLDVVLVRILLVSLIFAGGTGVILYLILWVSAPEARTVSDRMRMRGEAINLGSIDQAFREGFATDAKDRSTAERILLLPFQAVGAVARSIVPLLKGLIRVVGVVVGLLLMILAVTFLGLAAALLGSMFAGHVVDWSWLTFDLDGVDLSPMLATVPQAVAWLVWAILALTGLSFIIAGVNAVAGRRVVPRYGGWAVTLLWVSAILGLIAVGRPYYSQFAHQGQMEAHNNVALPATQPLHIAAREIGGTRFRNIQLGFGLGRPDSLGLAQTYRSFGVSIAQSQAQAGQMKWAYTVADSGRTLLLDDRYTLPAATPFRFQEAAITLELPAGKPFYLSHAAARLADDALRESGIHRHNLPVGQAEVYLILNEDGTLQCLNCRGRIRQPSYMGDEEQDWQAAPPPPPLPKPPVAVPQPSDREDGDDEEDI